jgi:hypothetical protein
MHGATIKIVLGIFRILTKNPPGIATEMSERFQMDFTEQTAFFVDKVVQS